MESIFKQIKDKSDIDTWTISLSRKKEWKNFRYAQNVIRNLPNVKKIGG